MAKVSTQNGQLTAQPIGYIKSVEGVVISLNTVTQEFRILQAGDPVYSQDIIANSSGFATISLLSGEEIPILSGMVVPLGQLATLLPITSTLTPETLQSTLSESNIFPTELAPFAVQIFPFASGAVITPNLSAFNDEIIIARDGNINENDNELPFLGGPELEGTPTIPTVPPVIDLNSGVPGTGFNTNFTEDSGAVGVTDAGSATITDPDSTNLSSLTVTIVNLQDGAAESLDANVSGTAIAKSYDAGTGTLLLSGTDSIINYQQVLRTVTYNNTSQDPATVNRNIEFVANDGANASNTAVAQVLINSVNDPPILDLDASTGGANFLASFVEDGGSVTIANNDAFITDIDSMTLSSLTVSITNLLDGADETLDANVSGTSIVKSYDSGTGILTLSGVDSIANYQQVLRTVTYNNTSQNPNTTSRIINFVANDGSDNSNTATSTVSVTNNNDAPVIDLDADNSSGAGGSNYQTSFTEDSGTVAVADSDASIIDIDTATLSSLTVTITNLLDGAAESLDADVSGTSITKSYDSGTGILTLSGVDSVTNYQQVLRTVTYNNTSQDPNTAARNVTFVATDSGSINSNTASATVTVFGVNDGPVIDLDADNSAAPGANFVATFTEDSGAVAVADVDATITDVDSSTLSSLTVTITNLLDGTAESLDADVSGTAITKSYDSGTGILTLSGADTIANYQQVLRTVTYNNTDQNPDTAARSITFVANDGTDNGNTATTTVTVLGVNDAPVIDLDANDSTSTGANFAATFSEDSGGVVIADSDATITDIDNTNLQSLTVTITNLLDGTAESLDADVSGTAITKSYDSGTGILTLSGADTIANYQQVLRTVTYNNTDQNPDTTARSVTFVVNDGAANSNIATTTVTVLGVNDAPVIDLDANDSTSTGANFAATFSEDSGGVVIADSDATITDIDNTNLQSLTVTITNLQDGAAESLDADVSGTSIAKSYDSGTGILTLSGADTIANYQQVLRTVTYNNTDQNPDTTARAITFVVNDGAASSNIATTTVTVLGVNDAPVIDLDANDSTSTGANFAATFSEDSGGVVIADSDATITDIDNTNLQSLTVTITNLQDGAAESLDADVSGTSIIKSYDSGTGILTLSGADTIANYQQVLRTVTYNNTDQNPDTTARSVTFVVNDGAANSNIATTTVTVLGVNDAPVIDLDANDSTSTGANFAATFSEDSGGVVIADSDATITDIDNTNLQSLTVTITNLQDGAAESLDADVSGTSIIKSYDSGTGILTLSGADTIANYQQVLRTVTYNNTDQNPDTTARSVTFVVNDGTANSNIATTTVTVLGVNDAPVIDLDANDSTSTGANFAATFSEDSGGVVIADSDATITDIDNTNLQSLTVTITNLQDGAAESLDADVSGTSIIKSYDSGTGILTLSGADTIANYQQVLRTVTYNNTDQNPDTTARSVTFVVNDGAANSNIATTTVTVLGVNDAPVIDLDANDSTSTGANFAATFSEDSGGVVIADSDATITDIDNTNLQSLTVTITNLQDGAAESLDADVSGTSIIKSYDSGTGILTLSGADTIANYQQVLRTVTYNNTDQNPDTTARSVTFVVNDGAANSNIATTTVTVLGVNDAPVIDLDANDSTSTGANFAATFSEDSGGVVIADSDATITDIDNTNLQSLTVTITNLQDGAAESLDADVSGTSIIKSYDSGTGILTLSGADTIANYQQVLRTVTYNNTDQNPDTTARSVTFVVNDGAANSNIATTTVTVLGVNDAPVIDLDANDSTSTGANFAATFSEDSGGVVIADSDATITDIDNTNLQSLTVTITNLLDGAAESLDADVSGTSIAKSYDSGTGILTLSGADTIANYQQVLRTVTYNNTDQNPDTTARSVTFVVNDGTANSNIATTTVTVLGVNDAPVIDLDANDSTSTGANFAATFSEDSGGVVIADSDATITDIDNTNLQSLTVTITNLQDGAAESLDADVSGTSIIKSYDSGTGILTLSGADTIANYQQVLRTVTYNNTDQNPDTTARSVTFVVNDGAANSNIATTTVTVLGVNDAPVIDLDANDSTSTGANFAATFSEDSGGVVIADSDATITDIDNTNLQSLTVTITNLQDGAAESLDADVSGTSIIKSYDSGTGILTLSGADTIANYQQVLRTVTYNNTDQNPDTTARSVTFVVNDGAANSNIATTTVTVLGVNDAPVIDLDANDSTSTGANFAATFSEDSGGVVIADSDATITDIDNTNLQSLTVTITNLQDGAAESLDADVSGTSIIKSYDSVTGILTLSGADTIASYQQVLRTVTYNNTDQNPDTTARSVTFVVNDGAANSNIATTTVTVLGVNDAPVIDLDANDSTSTGANFAATFSEDSGGVVIADSDATITDIDNTNLQSLTVTITNLQDGAAESLDADVSGTSIIKSYDSGTGILTLSGADTIANYQQVLRTVTYNNTDQNPDTTARSVTFVVNDGAANSNIATTTVTVLGVNDAPVIDLDANDSTSTGANFAATFSEDSGGVVIADSDATITDIDNTNLQSLTVTITNLQDGVAESLDADVSGTSIAKSYDSGTGILTLSGADTIANYQQVLRTVTYNNTDQNPDTTARAITFVVNDGAANSNIATTTVSVIGVNDGPIVDLDASAGGNDFGTSFTEDGGTVVIADSDATITDPDSTTLTSLTITITNLLDGTFEVLDADVSGTSIAKNYDSGTGILTLSGVDTIANYQQVLRTVTYNNADQNPDTTARIITFIANDGTENGNTATTTLTVLGVNDAPLLDLDANDSTSTGANFAATFTEDAGNVVIADSDATITDVDSTTMSSLTITITNLLDGTAESLDADVSGTSIAKSYDSGTGILTLSGADTIANYQQVLRTVTYNNTDQNPDTTARIITFVVNDGSNNSNTATTTVTVLGVNDAPLLDLDANDSTSTGANFAATFSEDSGGVVIADSDATITDVDSATMSSLTITITNLLDGTAESLDADVSGTSIAKSYDSGTGILTLSGADTIANYQQVLRTVTYNNTDQNPDTTARIITFVVNDGSNNSNTATTTVTVLGVNDAPLLDLDANDSTSTGANFAATFTEDAGNVVIADSDATITDVDSTTMSSLTITITNLLDGTAESLDADVSGTSIIKSYDSGTGILTLSGADTIANYQQVLRTVTYNNTDQNPDTTARIITFVVNDGSNNSNTATTTVTVLGVNDAPLLDLDANDSTSTGANFAATFTEDAGNVVIADSDATITDVDSTTMSSLTITITNLLDGTAESLDADVSGTSIIKSYDSGTGILTLSGADTIANYQQVLRTVTYNNTDQNPDTTARIITFIVNDGSNNSNTATTTVTVLGVNDAPLLDLDANDSTSTGANFAATFSEDSGGVVIADSDATITDVDSTTMSSLTITITNLLDGTAESLDADVSGTSIIKSYDSGTGILTLSGADTIANYQQVLRTVTYNNTDQNPDTTARIITFVVNDGSNNSNTATTTVTVLGVNDAPLLDLDANDSTSTGANFAATFTEDAGNVVIADSDATITDVDSTTMSSLTITITNLLDGTAESLDADVSGTSIAKSYDSGTGILTLSGADTIANYQQVLRTVTYNNTDQNPDTTARIITFVVNDGSNNSNTATTTVTVLGVNDAPLLDLDANDSTSTGANFAATFTEDAGNVVIADSDATITDVDSTTMSSLTITITNLLDGTAESLDADVSGTSIIKSYDSGTGILTLSGADTIANYQQVLRTVTYNNTDQNPDTTARIITFVVNDGSNNSNTATTTVTVLGVNDAPLLDLDANDSTSTGANFAATFTEDAGNVVIADSDATITDVDSTTMSSLTITITNLLDGTAESLDADVSGTSIIKSYDSGTGILTLSGADTIANYQQVLRTVTYNNTDQNPDTTARIITFVVNDGSNNSNTATTTVTVLGVNDAPLLDLDANDSTSTGANFAATFSEDSGGVVIADSDATITDVDSTTMSSLTITITNLLDGTAESLDADVSGTSIIKSYDSGTGILTLSGADTIANYQQVLRTVTYNNTDQNPDTTARIITFVVNDGSNNSNTATTTVTVLGVNDAPLLDLDANDSTSTGANFAATFTEDAGNVVIADSDATITDVDSTTMSSLTITITNLLDGTAESLDADVSGTSIAKSYDSGTGILTLSGADTIANYQQVLRTVTYNNTDQNPDTTARIITFVVNDGSNNSNTATTTVTVLGVNDAPLLDLDANDSTSTGANFAATFSEDSGGVVIADSDATITDVDSATMSSLTITITNLLDGTAESLDADVSGTSIAKSYDSGTGILTLSGADTIANYQQVLRTVTYNNTDQNPDTTARIITFVVNDGSNNSNTATTTVTVLGVNDAPLLDLDANDSTSTGANFAATFTEDAGNVVIADSDATITDVDSTTMSSLTITITNLLDGTAESLDADVSGTSIAKSYDSGTGILTLSGADTIANYQQVLRTVTYNNTDQNPDTTARIITFVVNDGSNNSNTATTTVTVLGVNDAPLLDLDANDSTSTGANFAATFSEDSGGVVIADSDATITDVDSATMSSLTITITNLLDGTAESLDADVSGTSIIKSYDSGTGILTLSGADTIANYQQVLRTVTYNNASQNPNTAARSITFVVNDGSNNSNTATTTVTMIVSNDAPVIDLDANDSAATGANFVATFTEDGGNIAITDTDAIITDLDSTNLTSLTVTITNLLDGTAESLDANVSGTSIIKNYDSVTGILTLSGLDTVANYQQVLRTVSYDNTSQDPDTTARSITFVANDGADNSNTATTTVTVVSANDAPVLDLDADNSAAPGADFANTFTAEFEVPVAAADSDATISDVDNGTLSSLTVTITNLLDGTAELLDANISGTSIAKSYDSGTGILTLSGVDSVTNYQTVLSTVTYNNTSQTPDLTARVITFVANDGADNSNTGTTTITMFCSDDNLVTPTISGTSGNDTLVGTGGADIIAGFAGVDTISGGSGNDIITGGDGDDALLRGQQGNDTIYGQCGDDNIRGNGGIDTLYGGFGNDDVRGGGNNDTLYGGRGDDNMLGQNGNDVLFGQEGNDTLNGGNGADDYSYEDFFTDGQDTITTFTTAGGGDEVHLGTALTAAGLGNGDVSLSQSGSNVLVTVNTVPASTFQITIQNQLVGNFDPVGTNGFGIVSLA